MIELIKRTKDEGLFIYDYHVLSGAGGQEVMHGPYTMRHRDGRVMEEGFYENGQREGLWKVFHQNGVLAEEGNLSKDEQVGIWRWLREDGSLEEEGEWVSGQQHGKWKYFCQDGRVFDGVWQQGQPWSGELVINGEYFKYKSGSMIERRELTGSSGKRIGRSSN